MTTTINEAKTITLLDGSTFEARPLKISLLRTFMNTFSGIDKVADDNDKSTDILMQCVVIALGQYKPELAKDPKALEDLLDLPTVYQIIEEASGVKLADANNILSAI